jgi:hypothetical protein
VHAILSVPESVERHHVVFPHTKGSFSGESRQTQT